MDWVEGTDLGRLLHARGRPGLGPSLVLRWLADAAAALTHLHSAAPAGRPRRREAGQPRAHRERPGGARRLRAVVVADLAAAPHRDRVASPRPSSSPAANRAAPATCTPWPPPPSPSSPADRPPASAPPGTGIDPAQAAQLEDGDPPRPEHRSRPSDPSSAGELVERLRAGLARVAAHRRAHVLPHRHRRLDLEVGDATGRHVAVARGARRPRRRRRRAPRRPLPRGAGRGRLDRHDVPGARCGGACAAIDIVNGLATTRGPATSRSRSASGSTRARPTGAATTTSGHAQHGRPAPRPRRRRRDLPLPTSPPGSWSATSPTA